METWIIANNDDGTIVIDWEYNCDGDITKERIISNSRNFFLVTRLTVVLLSKFKVIEDSIKENGRVITLKGVDHGSYESENKGNT